MNWEEALNINNGDYAYAPDGGMLQHNEDGTYTVRSGNLQAACAGDWSKVERVSLSKNDIPTALEELEMSEEDWSFE